MRCRQLTNSSCLALARWPALHTTNSSKQQQLLLNSLCVLAALLLLLAPAGSNAQPVSKPGMVTDADMGIYKYDSTFQVAQYPAEHIRIWLRFLCNDDPSSGSLSSSTSNGSSEHVDVTVKGFVSSLQLTDVSLPWAPQRQHYLPLNIYRHLNISIVDRSTNTKAYLSWVGPPTFGGLWRLKGQLKAGGSGAAAGPYQLSLEGSHIVHDLPHPMCAQQQRPGTPNLAGGIWNVLTTTSNTTITPKTLALLVLEHNSYHRSMGLSGTILRSNVHESRALMQLPDVQHAVEQQGLIIWPWEIEHIANFSTHFWQRPKNQITLLGAYGRNARLAFFDLDEYLVLPDGGTVSDSLCFGQPLLLDKAASGSAAGKQLASWTFIRFQAKLCQENNADMPCWEDGRGVSGTADVQLLHDVCPMSTGHGKQIMVADMVDIPSVHFTFSEHHAGNHLVNMSCAHLLHFYSLLEGRRGGVTATLRKIPALTWNYDPVRGQRQIKWPEGLAPVEYETCKADPASRQNALIRYKAAHALLSKGGVLSMRGAAGVQHHAKHQQQPLPVRHRLL